VVYVWLLAKRIAGPKEDFMDELKGNSDANSGQSRLKHLWSSASSVVSQRTAEVGRTLKENMRIPDNMAETDRVRRHTAPDVLRNIDQQIEQSLRFYATQPESAITQRIQELDREWDMERVLETNASALALSGAVMGVLSHKKWFLLTVGVMGFLMQHAIQGWCPPVPAFRKLGIRTRAEIDKEKYGLKALRGDFKDLSLERPHQPGISEEVTQSIHV
jgi:hypothetical protein